MCFFKNAFENESGRVSKQTCSQSAVRGVSTRDARRQRSVHMTDIRRGTTERERWRIKTKEENVCGTKEGLHRVYTGRRAALWQSTRDAPNIRPPKIFGGKLPKSAFSVFGQKTFITETIRPKCCDDANRNRDLHVLVWSNMSAVWTYFSISQKDPRTAICKTCNAEISRGGASAKTFSTSVLIDQLKSKRSDHYAEYERNARGTEKENASKHAHSVCGGRFWKGKEVSQWHMGYGSLCFDTLLCWRPTEKILLYL